MKKFYFILLIGILLLGVIPFIPAQGVSYCCEKTTYGSFCQNEDEDQCDPEFRKAPTSCESTSYCKEGTCFNSNEGTCLENTPQQVCQDNGGSWDARPADELPQCSLGCCLIGDQASFVTQTRCKALSSLYGLDTNFRTDLASEFECIASATSDIEGACVFERDFEKTCLRTSQKECSTLQGVEGETVSFHPGFLCSADDLGTNCGPSKETSCIESKDQVFFKDTCGNLANVYDSTQQDNPEYWRLIKDVSESCNPDSSNAGSSSCGNCDYFLGSTCAEYNRGSDPVAPVFGDNVCRNLGCEYLGESFEHGETWCANSKGTSEINSEEVGDFDPENENLPGSRYFRLLCYNGEVTTESCADYRQEVCIEDRIPVDTSVVEKGFFSTAACRVNKWEDCSAQIEEEDCENVEQRDCEWLSSDEFKTLGAGDLKLAEESDGGICVPRYSPGFSTGEGTGDSTSQCGLGERICVVKFTKRPGLPGLPGSETDYDKDNEECLGDLWAEERNYVCSALGDCGSSLNYVDVEGFDDLNDLVEISKRSDNLEKLKQKAEGNQDG